MASLPRRGKLTVGCLRSPPRSPSPNHPRDVAGNPDASRCFVGRDSDRPAPHGSPDRGGWPGSAARPRAGRRAEPSVHSLVRSKSGHGRSGCRPAPEFGSARTETVGQSSPPRATAHMDAFGNDWNTAPACVLSTVWGTASIRDLAVEVGAVPASPIRQVLTACRAGCAGPKSSAPASLWICGQHKSVAHNPTGPTAAADNLNDLEISSVRATPGSPLKGNPQGDPAWALLPLPPSLRGFGQPFTGLYAPLPTLRLHPREFRRTARGRCGSLLLHRFGLAPITPCRPPGAHSVRLKG